MMLSSRCKKRSIIAMLAILSVPLAGQVVAAQTTAKKLYLPKRATRVPAGNDYNNVDSEFCFKHMVQNSYGWS
jgi:hypothetical protein